MTRTLLAALAIAGALPIAARSQDVSPSRDEAQLRALLTEFLAGASRNDPAVHERFWDDELVYTRSAGRRLGKAEILRDVRAAAAAPAADEPRTDYSAEDVRVRLYGETAVVAFRLVGVSSGPGGGRAEYLNTGTFAKRGGLWKAVAWQATRVPLSEDEARREASAADAALHAALLAGDVATLGRLLDPGFVWIHSDGRRLTAGQLIDQLRTGALRYAQLETRDVTVSVHGATAVVRGASSRRRSAIPEAPGTADDAPRSIVYSLTLAYDGGAWKAVAMHTSRLAGS